MKEAVNIFQALGNGVRFKILKTLLANKKNNPKSGGLCVCKLLKPCKVANSTMTHHLDWLRSVGLLTSEKRGQWVYYDVNMDAIRKLKVFVEKEF